MADVHLGGSVGSGDQQARRDDNGDTVASFLLDFEISSPLEWFSWV